MLAYPSVLYVLAHEALAGRSGSRRVLAGAEPLLPEIRAATEQAWGVKVINIWGASEGGGNGAGCDRSLKMPSSPGGSISSSMSKNWSMSGMTWDKCRIESLSK
jgi:acyl-coenzyme A synthetase/AMP-(fatty) acid ligase